jgi:hypothetical protein
MGRSSRFISVPQTAVCYRSAGCGMNVRIGQAQPARFRYAHGSSRQQMTLQGASTDGCPLQPDHFASWLDGSAGIELLTPVPNNVLRVWRVSRRVNSLGND